MIQTSKNLLNRISKFINNRSRKIELHFFYQKEYSLFDYAHEDHTGQYIVRYISGLYEVIPGWMYGTELKNVLGYRALKIQFWAFLPDPYCDISKEVFGMTYRLPKASFKKEFFPYDYVTKFKREAE